MVHVITCSSLFGGTAWSVMSEAFEALSEYTFRRYGLV